MCVRRLERVSFPAIAGRPAIAAIAAGLNEACQRRRGIIVRRLTSRPRFLPVCGGSCLAQLRFRPLLAF